MDKQLIGIGSATISIDIANNLGHHLIWPHKDIILDEMLDVLHQAFNDQSENEIYFKIDYIEPGCIKVKLEIMAAALTILAACASLNDSDTANGILKEIPQLLKGHDIKIPNSEKLCKGRVLASSLRGLYHGPVKNGETLNDIALKLNPKGVTSNMVIMALYKHNPDAFFNNNINNLKEGAYLSLPKSPCYLSKFEADNFVEMHNSDWKNN